MLATPRLKSKACLHACLVFLAMRSLGLVAWFPVCPPGLLAARPFGCIFVSVIRDSAFRARRTKAIQDLP